MINHIFIETATLINDISTTSVDGLCSERQSLTDVNATLTQSRVTATADMKQIMSVVIPAFCTYPPPPPTISNPCDFGRVESNVKRDWYSMGQK
jgi:hypothetical protein